MIRLIWRTDLHLSDRPPASRKDDWNDSLFEKLEQVKLVAAKVNADAVLDGGDYFHVKSPSRNSHELVRRSAEHHANYPCPVYCTPGNHDSVYGDYEYLGQQPLGVLFAAGIFKKLYDEHEAVFEKDGVKVRVVGIPYHGTEYDMERFTSIKKGDEDFLVVVAHVLASPTGGSMFEGEDIVKYRDLSKLDPDMWMFGHWHKDQGVQKVNDTLFVNVGSMSRGALTQDDLDRKPAIVLLSFDKKEGIKTQILRLRVKPGEEVFDLDARVRAEARTDTMDAFVQVVQETLVAKKKESLTDTVSEMESLPQKVRERAMLYLEQAR
jgi:DNA repair exonuclease SbcCD nuclease subunit